MTTTVPDAYCCCIDPGTGRQCDQPAAWELIDKSGHWGHTHACGDHVEALKSDTHIAAYPLDVQANPVNDGTAKGGA